MTLQRWKWRTETYEEWESFEPDNLLVEVWTSLGRTGVNCLKEALDKITGEEKIPDVALLQAQ